MKNNRFVVEIVSLSLELVNKLENKLGNKLKL